MTALRNIQRSAGLEATGGRWELQPAAQAYARAKRCACIHTRLMARSFHRYGDHGPLISGIGAGHFPESVKARARALCAAMNRHLKAGDALRPPRVHTETMRNLCERVRARFPRSYYL